MVRENISDFPLLDQTGPQPFYYGTDGVGNLFQIEAATGIVTTVGPIGATITGLALTNSGQLYGLEFFSDDFYVIDRATGAGTLLGLGAFLTLRY